MVEKWTVRLESLLGDKDVTCTSKELLDLAAKKKIKQETLVLHPKATKGSWQQAGPIGLLKKLDNQLARLQQEAHEAALAEQQLREEELHQQQRRHQQQLQHQQEQQEREYQAWQAQESLWRNVIVTTCDLKQNYRVVSPIYFQISNKGFFSNKLAELSDKYTEELLRQPGDGDSSGLGTFADNLLFGNYAGQNDFQTAFYISTYELKKIAKSIGADAVIGFRQDIDLDTNGFQYFYMQSYGTAVAFERDVSTEGQEAEILDELELL